MDELDPVAHPKPMGMWTKRHIAADPRVALTVGTLAVGISNGTYPPLQHDYKFGPTSVYSDYTVERWISEFQRRQAEAPARRAAERARRAEREQFELEEQTRRLAEQKRIADSTAAFEAAARAEQDRLDQEQRNIAFHQAELNANRRG